MNYCHIISETHRLPSVHKLPSVLIIAETCCLFKSGSFESVRENESAKCFRTIIQRYLNLWKLSIITLKYVKLLWFFYCKQKRAIRSNVKKQPNWCAGIFKRSREVKNQSYQVQEFCSRNSVSWAISFMILFVLQVYFIVNIHIQ